MKKYKKSFFSPILWKMWKTFGENSRESQEFAGIRPSFPQSFPHFQQVGEIFLKKLPFCAFCTTLTFYGNKVGKTGRKTEPKRHIYFSVFGKMGGTAAHRAKELHVQANAPL